MKKFTFRGVLDGFRNTVQPQTARQEQEIHETLRPEHFAVKKTFRHGFPYSPSAFAFDPVQRLLVIGDKSGSLRLLGRPGVDTHVSHEGESACAVILSEFIVNDGKLVTVTADDTIHLWNIRQKVPQVIQSLKFQRERVTCIHLAVASKWLYVGTEKGNIHVVNIDTFALSGYVINWNKAIELGRATHPGAVIALCDNPIDANKLLLAYECGLLVLWDLKGKCAEIRWVSSDPVKSIAWHYEGKYFVSSHKDGSICSWPMRPTPKPQSLVYPHAKTSREGTIEKCNPIFKVDLKASQSGETFTIFSGGMPTEKGAKSNCITVMVGKTTTVLEMEHAVVDFITLCENPWTSETQEPYAIAVLLQYDLVLIDLLTPGFPCFESPYPMDLHESPVTYCTYLTDCPSDLVPAFYSVGRTTTSKKTGFSEREWPVSGGEWSPASCSYAEIVITGHQDGTLKFWDSGAGSLQILYKLKTAKIFEKSKSIQTDSSTEHPLAIQLIHLCSVSRRLCVAGAMGQVILFKFRKVETTSEVLVLEIPILFENFDDIYGTSPECDFIPHQVQKTESSESDKTDSLLRVKSGAQRKPPGFQSQLVCLTTGPNKRTVQVTSLCISSAYGLMAYGTEYGLVIIDIIQKVCLLSIACPDLYGAHDPYSRTPKSPKRIETKDDQSRSPSSDQLHDTTSPDSPSIEYIAEANESNAEQSNPSSRPASPEEERGAVGGGSGGGFMFAKSPIRDETSIPPKDLPDRRKSMSWKTFNLKRQLSKVNMKIGLNMSNESETVPKSSSVFYTQTECSAENSDESPPKDPIAVGVECRESMTESSMAEVTDTAAESVNVGELERAHSSDTPPPPSLPSKRVDFANDADAGQQNTRPNNLPITTSGGGESANMAPPTRPPRQKLKEKRDQRLLSVPNIKYQVREARLRTNRNDSSPSLGSGGGASGSGTAVTKKTPTSTAPATSACGSATKAPFSGSPNNHHIRYETNPSANDESSTGAASSSGGNKAHFTEQASTSSTSFDYAADGQAAAGSSSGIYVGETEKVDGSFSRSRSSSMSSIDMSSAESVTCLAFIESYNKRNDMLSVVPTLWVGTSFGSILTLVVSMPEREVRKSQPVLVTINGGPVLRLKGAITSMSFLDAFGSIIPFSSEPWRDDSRDAKKERTPTKSSSRTSPTFTPTTANTISNTSGGNVSSSASSSGISGSVSTGLDTIADRQYIVIASEKQTKVFDIANQCCVNRIQFSEMDFAVKAKTITMKDGTCLATYLSNGHLMVHSLPSLKLLMDTEFLPLMDLSFQTKCKQGIVDPMLSIWGQQIIVHEDITQISKIFCFSNKGHGLYMASPTEIQKFTISSEFCQFILDMMGSLYTVQEMPEQPKESFFKGLFGGGAKSLDREELFGEQSGKANRSIAKHIPGPTLEQLNQRASTAASEISRAHLLAMERGEKLNMLEERAERMANQAQDFSGTAHSLMLKYKDKKWYQL